MYLGQVRQFGVELLEATAPKDLTEYHRVCQRFQQASVRVPGFRNPWLYRTLWLTRASIDFARRRLGDWGGLRVDCGDKVRLLQLCFPDHCTYLRKLGKNSVFTMEICDLLHKIKCRNPPNPLLVHFRGGLCKAGVGTLCTRCQAGT